MFSRTAAEDSRVVIRLDFTLVVPGGMSYSTDPEEIGPGKVLEFTDGSTMFSLDAPVPTGLPASYKDPVTRGVLRNHVAGRIRQIYGREVAQVVLVEEPRLLVISADKSDATGAVHFYLAGDQGLYHGTLTLPKGKIKEKDRLDAVKNLFATIGEYTAAPDEQARAIALAKQRRQEESAKKETAPAAAPKKEEAAGTAAAPAPEEKQEPGKPEEEKEEKPQAPEEQPVPAPAAEEEKKEEKEEAPEEAPAGKEHSETPLTPEELRIRTLEQQRQKKLAQLRAKYTGNPAVESQIDNYIARCERTADQVVQEFTDYLASVQKYAASTSFTGTDDPNYQAMLSDMQEAADSLGSQMDQVAVSADENATRARDAGVREPYVERLVRLMERLDKKYEAFAVRMGGGSVLDEITYRRPEEIEAIFRKWSAVRYTLPSFLEASQGEIEEREKEAIQKRIAAARDAIPALEEKLAEKEQEADAFEQSIPEREAEYDASLRSVEDRMQALEEQKAQKLAGYQEKLAGLQEELAGKEGEEARLQEHLDKTLSINMGRKRELQTKLTNLRNDLEEERGRIAELKEQRAQLGTAEETEQAELERQKAQLEEGRQGLAGAAESLRQEAQALRDEIADTRKSVEQGEEEFRHVHENYLLGKYDRQPE